MDKEHKDCVSKVYIQEKSCDVVNALVNALDLLEEKDILSIDTSRLVKDEIATALYDATKIVAITLHAPWEPFDCDLIADCGNAKAGWEAIQYKYTGKTEYIFSHEPFYYSLELLNELLEKHNVKKAKMLSEIKLRKDFLSKLISCMEQERGYARPLLNGIFYDYQLPDHVYKRMDYLLNRVNMGDLEWLDFVERIKLNTEYLQEKLKNENIKEYIQNVLEQERQEMSVAYRESNGSLYDGSYAFIEQECALDDFGEENVIDNDQNIHTIF